MNGKIAVELNFFEKAKMAFAEGRFEHAADLFLEGKRLNLEPGLCMKNWAVCMVRLGKYHEAIPHLESWLSNEPNDAFVLESLALSLTNTDQKAKAVEVFERRIGLGPMEDAIWLIYVECCDALNQLARAFKFVNTRADSERQNLFAQILLGRIKNALGDPDGAVETLLGIDGWQANVHALNELAGIEKARMRFNEANSYLAHAVNLANDHPMLESLLQERITVHVAAGEPTFLHALCQEYLQKFPQDKARIFCLNAYISKGMLEEAEATLTQITETEITRAELLYGRANVDRLKNNISSAISYTLEALRHRPDDLVLLSCLGLLFCDSSLPSLGANVFKSVLEKIPNCPQTRWNLAICQFLLGRYSDAFENAEYRWQLKFQWGLPPRIAPQMKRGDPIAGRDIYVYCEQGLGDTLQFVRFVTLLHEMGARVTLKVPKPLLGIAARCLPKINVVCDDPPASSHHTQIALLSIPYILHTDYATVPAPVSYLIASEERKQLWSKRLSEVSSSSKGRKSIAIAWSGAPGHKNDRNRSIAFHQIKKLFEVDADFFCIQKSVSQDVINAKPTNLTILDAEIESFEDTAAIMSLCDLTISVDSSPIHIAGALGVKAWLLLPTPCDWRWMLNGDTTVWYPNLKIFRQGQDRLWPNVLLSVKKELQQFCAT